MARLRALQSVYIEREGLKPFLFSPGSLFEVEDDQVGTYLEKQLAEEVGEDERQERALGDETAAKPDKESGSTAEVTISKTPSTPDKDGNKPANDPLVKQPIAPADKAK